MKNIHVTRRGVLALLLAAPTLLQARPMLIDDFTGAPQNRWRFFTDQVMGGVSTGSLEFGAMYGVPAMRLTGDVSTENRGGFVQARHDLPGGLPQDTSAITLRARGNGQRYFVHLRTSGMMLPGQYWQAGFDAGADWADITLPLSAFEPSGRLVRARPNGGNIRSVALVAYGRDHQADVALARIGTA
ncbi:CIA30 family protein [Thalassococcus sp. BH17M4-6]|uniref:CIA30 family protein n=1 Tax=Thalassococcus sp. BH17M4-6 TaxID=3413148 RepID=UPI003BD5A658